MQAGEKGVLIQEFTQYPGTSSPTPAKPGARFATVDHSLSAASCILFVVLAVALFYKIKGPIGGHGRHTGRLIERFTYFERTRALDHRDHLRGPRDLGAVMAFGKFFLLPIIGGRCSAG
jgi:formate dehydrogenase subunit gamma